MFQSGLNESQIVGVLGLPSESLRVVVLHGSSIDTDCIATARGEMW